MAAAAPAGAHLFHKGDLFAEHYATKEGAVLGVGTSGDVIEGVCRRTGQQVAVKSYKLAEMTRKQLRHLGGELAVHASLAHPGVVKVAGIYEGEEAIQIVTERLHGGELFDRVLDEPLPEDKAALVTRQLLETLAHLHARKIVHRDVKLENVMFEEASGWTTKLIDFGFATKVDPVTKCADKVGTLQYAPPELVQGVPYDEKADIWSLGCTVYTMITGKICYVGDDEEVIRKCRNGLVDYSCRFAMLPDLAQEFVRHLLTVDPTARPSAEDALKHPWLSGGAAAPDPEAEAEAASPAAQEVEGPAAASTRQFAKQRVSPRGARKAGFYSQSRCPSGASEVEPTKPERSSWGRILFPESYQMALDLLGMLWLPGAAGKCEEPEKDCEKEYDGPLRVVIEADIKDEH